MRERLAGRHGSLQPHAFGICVRPDGFDVAFHRSKGESARGVTMDKQFRSLRVQHSDFGPEVVSTGQSGCRPLSRGVAPGRDAPNSRDDR
jgi:hypothetical protein